MQKISIFTNIDIFFCHNATIFGPILIKFCMEHHDTIIYRSVKAIVAIILFYFLGLLAVKWAWSQHRRQMICSYHVLEIFRPDPPLIRRTLTITFSRMRNFIQLIKYYTGNFQFRVEFLFINGCYGMTRA